MRYRASIPVVVAAALVGLSGSAQSGCDQCPTPSVMQFDFDVQMVRPAPEVWNRDVNRFLQLLEADGVANDVVFNGNQQCIDFKNGDMSVSGRLRIGKNVSFPPPPGSLDTGDDYLFTGEIRPEGEGYRIDMFLETTCSRQRVHSTSGRFTIPDTVKVNIPEDSDYAKYLTDEYWVRWLNNEVDDPPPIPKEYLDPDWLDELSALTSGAFVPLLPRIRSFESRLRQTDRRHATYVDDNGLHVVPEKRQVKPFETVPMEITLNDCDGEPLPGREILLDPGGDERFPPSVNGRFEEPSVTTDDAGKATANFTVGAKRGVAIANVGILYLMPSGCENGWTEEAVLDVDGSAALYEVSFEYEEGREVTADTTETLDGGSRSVSYRDWVELKMRCTGIWENSEEAQQDGAIELSGAPIAGCRVDGGYRGLKTVRERSDLHSPSGGPGLAASDYTRTAAESVETRGRPVAPSEEPVDLFFSYEGADAADSSQFGIYVPFDMKSEATASSLEVVRAGGEVVRNPESDAQSSADRSPIAVGVPDMTYREERASIIVEGAYKTLETEDETTAERMGRVRAVITPLRSLDDAAK